MMGPRKRLRFTSDLTAALFVPVRRVLGPLHRRRPTLSTEQQEDQRRLLPLPHPWNEDERWYRADFPPRAHNDILPLIHGDEFFSDLRRNLLRARHRVTIAGWCLTPLMALARGEDEKDSVLAHVLSEVSQRAEVLVLLWSGAPALFQPTETFVEEARNALIRMAPRVRCVLDRRAAFSHDHHQKAITVDGQIAYVGGMDLCTFQGDRWDVREHSLRYGPNWHDVQLRIHGEVVRDVEQNFVQRWNAVTGESLTPLPGPGLEPTWNTPAQVIWTVPGGFYQFSGKGQFGIRHALLSAIKHAKRYIYLENQYIWAPEVVDALVEAMNVPRANPFRIVVVLPALAYSGRYDNDRHVDILRAADGGRILFEAYSLYASGAASSPTGWAYAPIYVHAKVAVVDDEWFCAGSANLNRRGLSTDTEINVQAVSPQVARVLRCQLWAEHLGCDVRSLTGRDPVDLIDHEWKECAERMADSLAAGSAPPPGHVHRYVVGRMPASRALDLIQDVTLEH